MQFIETKKPQVRREGLVLLEWEPQSKKHPDHTWDQGEHQEGCHKKLPGLGRRILVLARQGQCEEMGLGPFGKEKVRLAEWGTLLKGKMKENGEGMKTQ